MDSGSYNHVRRGTMPLLAASTAASSSYKANVNRTKTRKWVEAKKQSYDGDDWGNDDDSYDDDDQHHTPTPEPEPEPEPQPSARLTGLRQPGQTGHQLPSSRTFPSNTSPRMFGPPSLRGSGSGRPLLQHVQTLPTTGLPSSSPNATRSAHPTATPASHTYAPPGSQSSASTSTPPWSAGESIVRQRDRPDTSDIMTRKSGTSSASPSRAPTQEAKTSPFAVSHDTNKQTEDEKERVQPFAESQRPSVDSTVGQTKGVMPPGQLRSSSEQRRRTSFETHDTGSGPAPGQKSILASVVERKGDYAVSRSEQPPALNESTVQTTAVPIPPNEADDQIKADIVKSRGFSSSPKLPNLTLMSGFGDDLFSNSSHYGQQPSTSLATPQGGPHPLSSGMGTTVRAIGRSENNAPSAVEDSAGLDKELETANAPTSVPTQQSSNSRPGLPDARTSENPAASVLPKQPAPSAKREAQDHTFLTSTHSGSGSPITTGRTGPTSVQPATDLRIVSPSAGTADKATNADGANTVGAGQHDDVIASGTEVTATRDYRQTPKFLQLLGTTSPLAQPSSRPISTASSLPIHDSTRTHSPVDTAVSSGFAPTAPLDPRRVDTTGTQPDYFGLPLMYQRKPTNSTIDTVHPEKESDKLHEEIINSLSPAPVSPLSCSSLATPGHRDTEPGDLVRDSAYLSGVYDDYLSLPTDEKTIQDPSQTATPPTDVPPHQLLGTEESAPGSQDIPAQPSAPSPIENSTSEPVTRPRRFSWQESPAEETQDPVESKPAVPVASQESPARSQGDTDAMMNTTILSTTINAISSIFAPLSAEAGGSAVIPHQASQDGGRAPGDVSLLAIDLPSPISLAAPGTFMATSKSDESELLGPSLADEKEKLLIGDTESVVSNKTNQHPALTKALEPETGALSPPPGPAPDASPAQSLQTPTPFREIMNLGTSEERTRKFDEAREQFYVIESGLSDWLAHLQSQPDHSNGVMASNTDQLRSSRPDTQAGLGASSALQPAQKASIAASHQRRSSISHVQQLLAGQTSGFGASGNQMGTKSKELLHAAGAFGNKGVKSGMKLFNKGKSKFRERTGSDKAFF